MSRIRNYEAHQEIHKQMWEEDQRMMTSKEPSWYCRQCKEMVPLDGTSGLCYDCNRGNI